MGQIRRSIEDRFWEKVKKAAPEECWEWIGSRLPRSYGRGFLINGAVFLAHRISWIIHYGIIPIGYQVLHRCDNPPCVNPYHLFLGLPADNMNDKANKGRASRLFDERNPALKLSMDEIIEVRDMYASGGYSQDAIGKKYNVSQSYISKIIKKSVRAHVAPELIQVDKDGCTSRIHRL